jgi:hypothetical protein
VNPTVISSGPTLRGSCDDRSLTAPVESFGRRLRILDLPWLIRVKRAARRLRDLEVVAELEALRRADVEAVTRG